MPGKVADASVLGALLFREPRAEEAAALLSGAELFEPALMPFELASVARKKVLREPQNRDLILQALRIGMSLAVNWVEVDHEAAVSLALETGMTTYDASYAWVARACRLPLVTFDKGLRRWAELAGGPP